MPELVDMRAVYRSDPDDFADEVAGMQKAGATIVGGCCGTTAAHLSAIAKRVSIRRVA
jgi:5-methyltetrahydrofolate--homocysteine methyltransferase